MRITPLEQGFGVEVGDFDLTHGGSPEEQARLAEAYRDHHLIVFRGGSPVTPERQVEVTRWFGPIIVEGSEWTVLDNAEATGRLELPFHSDITFMAHPLAGISLCPVALPGVDTSTTYVSNAVAWDLLPPHAQDELADRRARHTFTSDNKIDLGLPNFEYWHPARMRHPDTGQPLLFVTAHHVDQIEGLSPERSRALLDLAFATLYAPERRYEHVWREGDLVVWNNIAIQHARTRVAEVADGPRIVRRVQLGSIGFLTQLGRLQQQAKAA